MAYKQTTETLKYSYRTLLTLADEVWGHNFLLRCIPFDCPFQRPIEGRTAVIPYCETTVSKDAFGNTIMTGYISGNHDAFMFESSGTIEIGEHITVEPLNGLYLFPTQLTSASPDMIAIAEKVKSSTTSPREWVIALSNILQENLAYTPGTTNVQTTASEAFAQHQGVCQDFAHIAISLCRRAGIAARYVNGFMLGEGATHAWIEYFDHGVWRAFDPTNNREVDCTYIKIAQGRDFDDCSTNRGRFCGNTIQNTRVSLSVKKIRNIDY